VDRVESLLDVSGIKADERILPHFGAVDGFGFDFIDGALGALLGEARDA
jgi:hypothetical protein